MSINVFSSYLSPCVCLSFLQITGRMDDVINVAGHRLATGEVENVLCSDELVSEAAVCERTHKEIYEVTYKEIYKDTYKENVVCADELVSEAAVVYT